MPTLLSDETAILSPRIGALLADMAAEWAAIDRLCRWFLLGAAYAGRTRLIGAQGSSQKRPFFGDAAAVPNDSSGASFLFS